MEALKSQGEIEAAVCDAVARFQQEYMGRGPRHVHTHLIENKLFVHLEGVLTAAEQRLMDSHGSGNGNGRGNDDSTVMDSGARRQWTEQGQLNGDGRRVGDTTTMDDEEGTSAMVMSTRPTMEATKANTASRD